MSRAVGVRKPQEAQKAKALWAVKAAKDRKDNFYDPARKEDISRRNKTRLELWEEHLKDPIVTHAEDTRKVGHGLLLRQMSDQSASSCFTLQ